MIRVIVLFALLLTAGAAQARRVAIVVANQNYVNVPVLANPLNDGRAVAAAFGAQGLRFDKVEQIYNTTSRDLRKLPATVRDLARGADTVVVYLAGHGMQDEKRNNYLLPVDADIKSPIDIEVDGLDIELIVQAVKDATPGVALIVVDACRENPFTGRMGGRNMSRGLARRGTEGLSQDMLIAYAADGGQVADDGRAGSLSPFAAAFVKRVIQPGRQVLQMLDEVADEVRSATAGRQSPTRDGNMKVSVTLVPAIAPPPSLPKPRADYGQRGEGVNIEREFWELCKIATVPGPCRLYVARYPTGDYIDLVKLRLEELAPGTPQRPPERPAPTVAVVRPTVTAPATQPAKPPIVTAAVTLPVKPPVMPPVTPPVVPPAAPPVAAIIPQQPASALTITQLFDAAAIAVRNNNMAEAAQYYRLAADQGSAAAQNNLGALYYTGVGVPQNKVEAARLYKLAAEQGLASAQYNLGQFYSTGTVVSQDKAEAARLYKLAAEQGNADAQANLGLLYESGTGVAQDKTEAARLYKLAAEQGNAFGQYNLGTFYDNGVGVAQDKAEAARLYKLAVDQGLVLAQYQLGALYYSGAGVPQDKAEAIRLFKLAADKGNALAQLSLGYANEVGDGVPQNKEEAARLYRLAADQGNAVAQGNLAFFHEYGIGGLVKDTALAIEWYRRAALQNNDRAIRELRRLGVTP